MATPTTADGFKPYADSTTATVDAGYAGAIQPGWPCALLPSGAPSVADRQSSPTADDLLPQILPLTPRGPAFGTDEAGDGSGASPWMRRFWRAIAGWVADVNARDWMLATQAFPSAITDSLDDWERELGLPDACFTGGSGTAARIAAVRTRFAALGGQSPAYFICLAASLGYTITIDEPTQFLVDVSAVTEASISEAWFLIDEGEVAGASVTEAWFRADDGALDDDPLESSTLLPDGDGTPLESFALVPSTEPAEAVGTNPIVESFFEADGGVVDDALEGFAMTASLDGPQYSGDEWKFWVVNVISAGETAFRIDDGELAYDPLEGFYVATDLECLLRRYCPPSTSLIFNYALAWRPKRPADPVPPAQPAPRARTPRARGIASSRRPTEIFVLYNPPTGSTDPNAPFVGKNTAAGTQGSKVPAAAVEYTQREIVAAIIAAGLSPTNADLSQLSQAIRGLSTTSSKAVISTLLIAGRTPYPYNAPGTSTLNVAAGAVVEVSECRGGGGGGGGADSGTSVASGGGGGANVKKTFRAITATVLLLTVGAGGPGGAGGASATQGVNGGTSSIVVQSGSVIDTKGVTYTAGQTLCAATGGGGGYGAIGGKQSTNYGYGGIASGSDINDPGDAGGFGYPNTAPFAGGSGGASPGSGSSPGPNYADKGNQSNAAGVGGNGSSANAAGGKGADGRINLYM
ncbi:DUF2313 domain-containing protein [Methylobacterium sp. E-041]|uniref:putative phage tail protein n=1 Tax=Methylobacterium sp. E-041 TaxID=2836573 RepID=UPI001FBBACBF|nr:putative phage tail protein [Methylobacterium sp. E-041]MCJ2108020.1 DUF2313 domain-containing protein [Methylobacterium sp. E-041]